MSNKLVIDSSVYISYGFYFKLYRLYDAIKKHKLEVYTNLFLLDEVERNLLAINKYTNQEVENIISALKNITIVTTIENKFTQSPDPKDNFLFDIAIQTNSEIIVSQEKALLQFANSPVSIHDIKWFKETYPVPL